MKIATYPFVKGPENYYYEFFSEGPNGTIKKVVEYFRWEIDTDVFNLAFGDWDEDNGRIDVMEDYPGAIILAKGSTPSRTRLYQMGIAKVLNEINQSFEIKGFINNSWRLFQKGINYSAFLLKTK
jgi:hypothetical protein